MDHPTRRRRPPRPVWLAAVLLVALLVTLTLAPDQARVAVQVVTGTVAGSLRQTVWAWPLAAVLTLAALTSPSARRRWPRPTDLIAPTIGTFAGLLMLASLATTSRPRAAVLIVGAAVAVGLLVAWVVVVPRRLSPPVSDEVLGRLADRDRLEAANAQVKLQNDLRTTALQAVAGLAVLAGAVLGFQQLTEDRQQATAARALTLQGQASERFTRAIDQLGSDRVEVQLGGIYGLEQIAQQAPDNRLPVTEVLVAYLHRRIPRPAKLQPQISPPDRLRTRVPDAQAALTVLGRRQTAPTDPPLDLRKLNLRAADLSDANLHGAEVHGADLHLADLHGADLRGADFGAYLARAAYIAAADLDSANLYSADLRGADLNNAALRSADLHNAVLGGAVLVGADLRGADLAGADLAGADLAGADLRGAIADQRTVWPDGFDWRGAGIQLIPNPGP